MRFGLVILACLVSSTSFATLQVYRDKLFRVALGKHSVESVHDSQYSRMNLPAIAGVISYRRADNADYVFSRVEKTLYWSEVIGSPKWKDLNIGPIYDGTAIGQSLWVSSYAGKLNRFDVRRIVKGNVLGTWQSIGEPALTGVVAFLTINGLLAVALPSKPTLKMFQLNTPIAPDARMLGCDGKVAVFQSGEWVYRLDLGSQKLQKTKLNVYGAAIVSGGALICGVKDGDSLTFVARWDGKRVDKLTLRIDEITGLRFVSDGVHVCLAAQGRKSDRTLLAQVSLLPSMRLAQSEWVDGSVVQRDSLAIWQGRFWVDLSTGKLSSMLLRAAK